MTQHVGWLIYRKEDTEKNKAFIDWFIDEGEKQQLNITFIPREQLMIQLNNGQVETYINEELTALPDFVINRTIEPVLTSLFTSANVRVFNPYETTHIANNKSLTHIEVNRLNIPMVRTIFTTKDLLSEKPPMDFPFVIKESTGRSGAQVHLIEATDEWALCRQKIGRGDLVIQSSNVKPGRDVRVFIVGHEIIAAVLRKSDQDFRANFTLGGSAERYPLNTEERKMIQTIVDHFEFGMVGIDFLLAHDGTLLFNEIEDIVGSRILSHVTDENILQTYVSYIKSQLK
ncbi:MAG TPA: hypothetical protein VK125_03995 [Bacillota bacterium]|nr:hypothetical protein [Bacillota bacterium]